MKIEFQHEPLAQLSTSALVAYSFEGAPASSGTVERLPAETRKQLRAIATAGELTGKAFECTTLRWPTGMATSKLLVVGAGKAEKFNDALLRTLVGAAVRNLRSRGVRELAWILGALEPGAIAAVVDGALVADYDSDTYRTERNGEKGIDTLWLATGGGALPAEAQAALDRGRILGEAQNFTRDLVNEPSNRMTPTILAERAKEMATRFGLSCEVLGPQEIQDLKMGAFWAVAQGSQQEPAKLIVIRYAPEDAPEQPVIGLIGKGITFDSGGISIKPSENMHEMKTDMAGGATMLGVMQAIAQLKPRVRVTALIPATENMPSGNAFKPGDVITSMSGKTIEILNTDAEGRLVLADALTYAKQLGCTVLIDAATLTGAVMVALGNYHHRRFRLEQGMGGSRAGCCRTRRERRCGNCPWTTIIATSTRARSPIWRTPAGVTAEPLPAPCSSGNSPAIHPGCISISREPAGRMMRNLTAPKGPRAMACAPWCNC